jgi:hypothetical protein
MGHDTSNRCRNRRSEAEVIIENSIESYLFTCASCATRWIDSYEVRQSVDEEGTVEAFYRHHGDPCEAPVSGNVVCPRCHGTRAHRNPLYGTGEGIETLETTDIGLVVPSQRGAQEDLPAPVRSAAHTWRRFRFSAVVTLDGTGRIRRQYLSDAPGLVLHVSSCEQPALRQYFPALVHTEDGQALRPGDKGVRVAISVPDDDAASFFQSGQHFIVRDGGDIGHGTVQMRLFFGWP